MTRQQVIDQINRFLIDDFEIPASDITPAAHLRDDLNIGSLEFVDIVIAIDQTFGFKPDVKEMAAVHTVAELYDFVCNHIDAA